MVVVNGMVMVEYTSIPFPLKALFFTHLDLKQQLPSRRRIPAFLLPAGFLLFAVSIPAGIWTCRDCAGPPMPSAFPQTDKKLIAAEGRFVKADLYLRPEILAPAAEAILRKTSLRKTVQIRHSHGSVSESLPEKRLLREPPFLPSLLWNKSSKISPRRYRPYFLCSK